MSSYAAHSQRDQWLMTAKTHPHTPLVTPSSLLVVLPPPQLLSTGLGLQLLLREVVDSAIVAVLLVLLLCGVVGTCHTPAGHPQGC